MFRLVCVLVACLRAVSSQVINLETNEEVEGTFLESGFLSLSSSQTISVTTANTFTYPVVHLSTVFSAGAYSDVIPVEARVMELQDNAGAEAVVTFSVRLIWPSNQTCVSQWNDGSSPQGMYSVGWYVGEEGGYTVSGLQMEFKTTTVNAVGWNLATWQHTFGFTCNYPAQDGDDAYTPGGVFTIQSNNNDGKFLTVRSSKWVESANSQCEFGWSGGYLRLYPHDAVEDNQANIVDETVGIFLFDARYPNTLDCLVGSYIEIGMVGDLSNSPHSLSMFQSVDTSSGAFGVFGSALTLTGGDAFSIKSYSESAVTTEAFTFIQEDKCVDEEIIHYPEVFSYFLASPTSNANCQNSDPILGQHTFAPTELPTKSPSVTPTMSPTLSLNEGSSDSSSSKTDDVLLAVFLPICIIVFVVGVGFVTKKFFLAPPLADSSDHSGLNLVP